MNIKDTYGEDENLSDMNTFSISDKIGFASAATTTFQISEPQSKRKPSKCCASVALCFYLLLLTAGQGLLAYKVFKMQREILKFQEQNTSYTEEILESSFAHKLLSERNSIEKHMGHEENWRRSLEEEITIIKSSNANLMMMMSNITLAAGTPGRKGDPGPPGPQGPPGTKGDRGIQGLQGVKGSKGDPGRAGPSGIPGVRGEKGDTGLAGLQGQKGEMGKKGDPGPSGPMGPQGQQGVPGLPGFNGNTGEPGRPGQKGEAGVMGQRGPVGTPGLDGRPGQKGEKGDHGPSGSPGVQGIAGPKGEKGDKGTAGLPGQTGIKGDRGLPGTPGPPGQNGRKGDDGSRGPKGEPGVKGQKGDRGYTGSEGSKGSKGDKGEGNSYNLIRIAGGGRRGRVEVFHNGYWGTICDDGWDTKDAAVVCRMLGYSRAVSAFTAAGGTGQIWLDEVDCRGSEGSIFTCSKANWGVHNCFHSEDAGVECI
ncbi:PREDICTED: macrophage receptor MARCO [Mesitornis unicolor]|uniref:macrophage receptor MARCO n=1 Tax=Mesitornis unicolor TaxID=54374 RepID=UPI000528DC04|nr:PREDICTED: macrophage receptor MARCO [Mesitornis unicolor]